MPASIIHLTKPGSRFVTALLARWEDGLYYAGEVVQCEKDARRCLVRFEDNSEYWRTAEELHAQLSPMYVDTEQIVCCVCDAEDSEPPNEIVLCDLCQQGYHINCHKPSIDREKCKVGDDDSEWVCNTCTVVCNPGSQTSSNVTSQKAKATPKRKKSRKSSITTTPKVRLDNKKNSESVKKILKREKENDVRVIATVQTPIEEIIPQSNNGGVIEKVDHEIAEVGKGLANFQGEMTNDVVSDIISEETKPIELDDLKPSDADKKKKGVITRVNRKPRLVAPAS